jgi:hypothetical protein
MSDVTTTTVVPAVKVAKGLNKKTAPNAIAAAKASKKAEEKAEARQPAIKKVSLAKVAKGSLIGDHTKQELERTASKSAKKASAKRSSAVADMCRELKIDPPLGRAKLRRAGLKAPYTDMTKVRAILTNKS